MISRKQKNKGKYNCNGTCLEFLIMTSTLFQKKKKKYEVIPHAIYIHIIFMFFFFIFLFPVRP